MKGNFPNFGNPNYGLTRNLGVVDFDQTREKVIAAFASVGFGLQTEMNLKETFKKKLNVDYRAYRILGFCHPDTAFNALQAEPAIGLLLPCNVCLVEDPNGEIIISGVSSIELFKVIGRSDIEPMATEIQQKISQAIESL